MTFPPGSRKRAVIAGASAPVGCTISPPLATARSMVAATRSTITYTRRPGVEAGRPVAMNLQQIEGNPLTPDEVAMFGMFEREARSCDRRRAYILAQVRSLAAREPGRCCISACARGRQRRCRWRLIPAENGARSAFRHLANFSFPEWSWPTEFGYGTQKSAFCETYGRVVTRLRLNACRSSWSMIRDRRRRLPRARLKRPARLRRLQSTPSSWRWRPPTRLPPRRRSGWPSLSCGPRRPLHYPSCPPRPRYARPCRWRRRRQCRPIRPPSRFPRWPPACVPRPVPPLAPACVPPTPAAVCANPPDACRTIVAAIFAANHLFDIEFSPRLRVQGS